MALVVYANYAIHGPMLDGPVGAEAIRNIVAGERLFRVSIVCDVLYAACLVATAAALYRILRPAGPALALAGALFRFVYALTWTLMSLNLLAVLRLAKGPLYGQALAPEALQALVKLHASTRSDQYYVGLVFWTIAATACSVLWWRSRYVPRWLAGFGIASSAWGVVCALAFLLDRDFAKSVNPYWFDSPLGLFEMTLSVWLLARGAGPAATAAA
jgi:hypothetical protein